MRVTVTGGAGYVGACVVEELLWAGHEAVVLDSLLHGQRHVGRSLAERGATVELGDIRDHQGLSRAFQGSQAVVHLAAIVGDPACAKNPLLSKEVNVEGSAAVVAAAQQAGVERLIFASTCSNYGRMEDPTIAVDETAELMPVSLYAEQKVEIEKRLLAEDHDQIQPTCLRFATVYGVAPRMRFDLTINEFTRDLWAGRELAVFGEQFWRPYVHARDAAVAVCMVLEAPAERVAREVFNVGHSDENYRKLDLVEIITAALGRGHVKFVHRGEDPRDYKVSFDKVRTTLGFQPRFTVPKGIEEVIEALESRRLGDPFDLSYSNLTSTPAQETSHNS